MKKLGLLVKEISKNQIKDNLKNTESVFVINYSKLSSTDLSILRQSLRSANARLFVVKNAVAKRSLKDSGLEGLVKAIEGPCGLVFIKDDPAAASRLLYNFSRGHEALKLQAGFIKDRILGQQDIEALARLPSRDVLRAGVTFALKSPISGLVIVLDQALRKFVWCLEKIKDRKGDKNG